MKGRRVAHFPLRGDPPRRISPRTMLVVSLSVLVAGAPLGAQYTAPGTPILARHSPSKAEFQEKVGHTLWQAGPFALSPWLGLLDASIVSDLNERGEIGEEDFTLTVGAGLRGYLSAGPKAILAAHGLPEYVWWQKDEAKRRLNGRYGLGFFVFFNRLTLELSQRRLDQQRFFSSEILALTTSRDEVATFSLELEVAPNLSLLGIAMSRDHENLEKGNTLFSALDRTDENRLIGVRYENPRGWTAELGHMDLAGEFADGARNLSNSGTAELASIGLSRPRIGFRLELAFNAREAEEGSDFGRFDETTGSFDVLWEPSRNIDILSYVRRAQIYSADNHFSYFLEERQGARVGFIHDRIGWGLFAEFGEDHFRATSPALPDRIDDVTAYGAEVEINLRLVKVRLRATRTDYDAGFDELDRAVTRFELGVGLEAISRFTSRLSDKLGLGSAGTDW